MDLILASTSPWRRKLLVDAGLSVRCVAPEVTEESSEPDADRRALALGLRKARAVAERFPEAWVLGADQVVTDGAEIWGKPSDPEDHLRRLCAMRGRSHTLITGFGLITPGGVERGVERTTLRVRADVSDAELEAYVADGDGAGCAGGYAAEGMGMFLFESIDGDFFNVLGLPMLRVLSAMRARGWRFGASR